MLTFLFFSKNYIPTGRGINRAFFNAIAPGRPIDIPYERPNNNKLYANVLRKETIVSRVDLETNDMVRIHNNIDFATANSGRYFYLVTHDDFAYAWTTRKVFDASRDDIVRITTGTFFSNRHDYLERLGSEKNVV